MEEIKRQTLAVLVDNESGVLSQITRLFSRKGYNIESLAVGITDTPEVSRITIEVMADDDHARQMTEQLHKLFPVHSVKLMPQDTSIRKELILYKVHARNDKRRNEIIQFARKYSAYIVNDTEGYMLLSMIDEEQRIEHVMAKLGRDEIIEVVRTGIVAMEEGRNTIYDVAD